MILEITPIPTKIQYAPSTLKRAEQALCCSPFQLALFAAMRQKSIPLQDIAGQIGMEQKYTKMILSERRGESELEWLFKVGLLRREVDGQGITDSFRLTPLGRQLVESYLLQGNGLPNPSLWERIQNTLNRWLRLPM